MPRILQFTLWVVVATTSSTVAAQSATFTYVAPHNGQPIQQRVRTHSNLVTTFEQSGQVISSEPNNVVITQLRRLIVQESDPERIARVRVTYEKAERRDVSGMLRRPDPQPVAGKTYHVSRPSAQADLIITYADGSTPAPAEIVIVDSNMQAVGKSNPLARFLNGKTVRVGERLVLPPELAADLLGATLAQSADNVFLTLTKLREQDGQAGAQFATTIVGADDERGVPAFSADGDITVAIATCRTLQLNMDAQVAVTEQRGPDGFTFEVRNQGSVRVEMESSYDTRSE